MSKSREICRSVSKYVGFFVNAQYDMVWYTKRQGYRDALYLDNLATKGFVYLLPQLESSRYTIWMVLIWLVNDAFFPIFYFNIHNPAASPAPEKYRYS